MDFGIKGKTALVLGGGGGLGRAIAKSLAGEGANVAVAGIGADSIAGSQAALAAIGVKSLGLVWDLADLAQIDGHISKIESELGPVDILINNSGGPPPTTAAGQSPELWSKYFQAMVLSLIATTDRVLPQMRARHWGRVITSTSSGVISPIPNLALSNTLRLSLVGWSKTLAREVAKDGVTVNVVAPGARRHRSHKISRPGEGQARRTDGGRSDGGEYGKYSCGPSGQTGRVWRRGRVSRQRAGSLHYGIPCPRRWRHDCEYLDGIRRNNEGGALRHRDRDADHGAPEEGAAQRVATRNQAAAHWAETSGRPSVYAAFCARARRPCDARILEFTHLDPCRD